MSKPAPRMKVRIVSDGTPRGTTVYDAVSGEKLDWIQKVALSVDPAEVRCELTVLVQVDEVVMDDVGLDEARLALVPADAKLPPCVTEEVDLQTDGTVPPPRRGTGPFPFPQYHIGGGKK